MKQSTDIDRRRQQYIYKTSPDSAYAIMVKITSCTIIPNILDCGAAKILKQKSTGQKFSAAHLLSRIALLTLKQHCDRNVETVSGNPSWWRGRGVVRLKREAVISAGNVHLCPNGISMTIMALESSSA